MPRPLVVGLVAVVALAACGDNARAVMPDAAMPDAPPDSAPVYPACAEFGAPAVSVPVQVASSVAGADVESPATCAAMDAPYGAESKGPDRVVPIRGLVAGSAYVVKLVSNSDLGFYVTTGCGTARGPAADQCLLFEDASLGGTELGRFVATGPTAFVVVDYYASHVPASAAFTLEVYAEQCTSDAECGGATPACSEGLCVACTSSFHCATPAAPRCEPTTNTCAAGDDACANDDGTEPADDGPAGARALADGVAATGAICSQPRSEADYFALDVTALGDAWELALAWTGNRDLDLEVLDADGRSLGLSFWEQPERVRLTYLPAGRYYARVREFGPANAASVAYALTATRTAGVPCTAAADCAAEYRNQIFRGSCSAGACVRIDGEGTVPEGGACDSGADCAAGLACPSFFFVADADERATCARGCSGDADCAPLGGDFVCTTYLASNFCVRKCTADDHCPTSLDDPPAAGPWFRLTCNVDTGRCVP